MLQLCEINTLECWEGGGIFLVDIVKRANFGYKWLL
jgi:hypothetical protein